MLAEIAVYLQSLASPPLTYALVIGTNLFVGILLDDATAPDAAVAIYEGTGVPPVYTMGGDGTPVLERPRLTVHVRDAKYNYAEGRAAIQAIWKELQKVVDEDLSGIGYQRIQAVGTPELFGRDEHQRPLFAANFDVVKELE